MTERSWKPRSAGDICPPGSTRSQSSSASSYASTFEQSGRHHPCSLHGVRAPALVVLALFCLAVTTACARRAYTVTVTDAPSPRTTQRTQRTEPLNEMRAQAQRLNEAARSRRDDPKAQDRGRDVQVPAPPDIARGTSGLSEQSG